MGAPGVSMGGGGTLGSAMSGLSDGISKATKGVSTEKIFGGDFADKVGLGQYKAPNISVDESAFKNTDRTAARKQDLWNQKINAENRTAPQIEAAKIAEAERIAAANLGGAGNDMRSRQVNLANALEAQAAGQGPSLAQSQLQSSRDQNIATAMALAASQRGQTAGQGLRSIQDQTASANQFAGAEAARQRIAEQLAAREQLSGQLATTRGMDVDVASREAGLAQQAAMANQSAANQFALEQAGLTQQASMANQSAGLQQAGMNDAFIRSLNQQMAGLDTFEQGQLTDLERLKADIALGREGLAQAGHDSGQKRKGDFISKIGEAGASVFGMGA